VELWARMVSGNFAEMTPFLRHLGIFKMPQSCDMGQTALLPLRRKACCGFFRPKNPTVSAGFEPAKLGTSDQHANNYNWCICWYSRIHNTSYIIHYTSYITHHTSYFGRLVAGLSPQGPAFDPNSVYVGFVADIVALGQGSFLLVM
jgi:hypothetical protein